jgi:hypothetical protein
VRRYPVFNWRCGCLLFIFFLTVGLYPVDTLVVKSVKGGRVFFLRRVSPGEGFEFSYIHSVDKTPVTGYFLITSGKRIKPVETQFESYGPGLPSMERGIKAEGSKLRVRSDVGEMEQLSFFVSPTTRQVMLFKGERSDFSSLKEGEVMTIRVKSYPLFWEVFLRYGK